MAELQSEPFTTLLHCLMLQPHSFDDYKDLYLFSYAIQSFFFFNLASSQPSGRNFSRLKKYDDDKKILFFFLNPTPAPVPCSPVRAFTISVFLCHLSTWQTWIFCLLSQCYDVCRKFCKCLLWTHKNFWKAKEAACHLVHDTAMQTATPGEMSWSHNGISVTKDLINSL